MRILLVAASRIFLTAYGGSDRGGTLINNPDTVSSSSSSSLAAVVPAEVENSKLLETLKAKKLVLNQAIELRGRNDYKGDHCCPTKPENMDSVFVTATFASIAPWMALLEQRRSSCRGMLA